MKWAGRRQSSNLEDRRGMSGGGLVIGGGLLGVVVFLINMFLGGGEQLAPIIEQTTNNQTGATPQELSEEDKKMGAFVSTVLADTEDIWAKIFKQHNLEYVEPKMVLFTSNVQSGCGMASAAAGPFYCPADQKIYMDLAFFEELQSRFGAQGGDFAIAYVIAHEVGHHVQNLLGISGKVHQIQSQQSKVNANKFSVALELQADYLAGVFTHYEENLFKVLEPGDIEEAMSAAQAVGDDAIQKKTQGHVVPDNFTHGSSEQRMYWFTKGLKTGDINQGDTFAELIE